MLKLIPDINLLLSSNKKITLLTFRRLRKKPENNYC